MAGTELREGSKASKRMMHGLDLVPAVCMHRHPCHGMAKEGRARPEHGGVGAVYLQASDLGVGQASLWCVWAKYIDLVSLAALHHTPEPCLTIRTSRKVEHTGHRGTHRREQMYCSAPLPQALRTMAS